jgi:2-dehydro-3-deoxyphosphooctonate aldolase (KDO 8-P synthase)
MGEFGVPVVFDVTHSRNYPVGWVMQRAVCPNTSNHRARRVACGVDAVFMEVHDAPERAPSDGPNMLPLARMGDLLKMLREIHELVHQRSARATV